MVHFVCKGRGQGTYITSDKFGMEQKEQKILNLECGVLKPAESVITGGEARKEADSNLNYLFGRYKNPYRSVSAILRGDVASRSTIYKATFTHRQY